MPHHAIFAAPWLRGGLVSGGGPLLLCYPGVCGKFITPGRFLCHTTLKTESEQETGGKPLGDNIECNIHMLGRSPGSMFESLTEQFEIAFWERRVYWGPIGVTSGRQGLFFSMGGSLLVRPHQEYDM
jgi:hypothetical protein